MKLKKKKVSLLLLGDIIENIDRLSDKLGILASEHAYGKFGATCSSACNGCCHQKFDVTFGEGLALARWLIEQGRFDDKLLDTLAAAAAKMNSANHREHMLSKTPCVFLESGRCSVYPARPLTCRLIFVRSDPALCHPDSKGVELVQLMDPTPWAAESAKIWAIVEQEMGTPYGMRKSLPEMVARGIDYLAKRFDLKLT